MKKSITRNYIYNLTYQILVLILPLITTPYISRVLGAENIGIYSYTISIVTYFILFGSLGIAMYGQREIAYLQDNKEKYSKTFWEIFILRLITMFISMIIFYFTFAKNGEYSIYYKILLLEMITNCLDISWFFQGLEEFKKTVTRNIIVKIISIICIFTFVKTSNDLIKYFWIYVLSTLIGNVSLWVYMPKYINNVRIKELNILRHLKTTVSLFVPQIAIQIYTVLDKVMIGTIISDKSEVGFYEQSQKIIKMLLTIITSLGTVMLPRIANTYINGDKKKIQEYMKKAFNFVFLLSFPMIFGIIAVANNFVPLFFGEGYDKVAILMSVISPILLFIGLSNVIGTQYLLPTKRQKEYTISVVTGSIVNFTINMLLIKKYGALGASIGTVIAEISVTAIQFIFVRKDFKITEILKTSSKYLVSAIIMFIVCLMVGKLISNNMIGLILQVFIGFLVYIAILLLLKNEFIYSMIDKVKIKLQKKKIYRNLIRIFITIVIGLVCVICSIYCYRYYEDNIKKYDIQLMDGWYKYQETPIIGNENTGSIFDPNVIKDENGNFRMYVSWRDKESIAVTTSKDGINWTELKIVLEKNVESGWEDIVNRATVIYKDGMYLMWYTGQIENESKIGYAISEDGYNFKRKETPIVIPQEKYEAQSVMNPYVMYDEDEKIFKMWYSAGEQYEPDVLCYATSTDGINWDKCESNPILSASKEKKTLDNYKVGACEVKKLDKDKYLMFYIGYSDIHTARIFIAKSENGVDNWIKNNTNPIISPSKGKFDSEACYKPSAIWDEENDRWLVYYNGRTEQKEYIGLYIYNKYQII